MDGFCGNRVTVYLCIYMCMCVYTTECCQKQGVQPACMYACVAGQTDFTQQQDAACLLDLPKIIKCTAGQSPQF